MLLNPVSPWYTGLLGLRQVLRYVVLYYIAAYAGLTRRDITFLLYAMTAVVGVEVLIGALQAVVGASADAFLLPGKQREFPQLDPVTTVQQFWLAGQRVFATLGRYDRLGTFLMFFLTLFAGLSFELKNPRARILLRGFIILSLPTLFLSYSRMSWLGFALSLVLMGVVLKRSKMLAGTLVISSVIIAAYLVSYLAFSGLQTSRILDSPSMKPAERILELVSLRGLREGYRGLGRAYFVVNVPQKLIAQHPVFGVGPGQFGGGVAATLKLHQRYDEAGLPFGIGGVAGQIDNNWFSLWGEVGTLGVLAFLWMLCALWYAAYRTWRTSHDSLIKGLSLGYMGALCTCVFVAFFGPYFEVRTLSMYMWLFGGIIVAIAKERGYQYIRTRTV